MIYLLHGEDNNKSREKLHILVDSLRKKKPDALYFQITDDTDFDIHELIHSQGLFEKKYIVVFDHVLKEGSEEILKNLKELKSAEHIFIFLEGKIDKKILTKFEKYAERAQVFETKEHSFKKEFNIFSLTDALGSRNREKLWINYQEALKHKTVEEIHGMLFWQVKCMLLSEKEDSPNAAGLKPFVYQKSKSSLKNFNKQELEHLSSKLISISHDAKRGLHEFELALERLILAI